MCSFQGTILTVLSVIRKLERSSSLITGKNQYIYKQRNADYFQFPGTHLLSHTVSSIVPSAA